MIQPSIHLVLANFKAGWYKVLVIMFVVLGVLGIGVAISENISSSCTIGMFYIRKGVKITPLLLF
jgi:hypothetical protein